MVQYHTGKQTCAYGEGAQINEGMKEHSSESSCDFKFWGHFKYVHGHFTGLEMKNWGIIRESAIFLVADCTWLILLSK